MSNWVCVHDPCCATEAAHRARVEADGARYRALHAARIEAARNAPAEPRQFAQPGMPGYDDRAEPTNAAYQANHHEHHCSWHPMREPVLFLRVEDMGTLLYCQECATHAQLTRI